MASKLGVGVRILTGRRLTSMDRESAAAVGEGYFRLPAEFKKRSDRWFCGHLKAVCCCW